MIIQEITDMILRKKTNATFIIAIDGGGGAGKSTLAGALQKTLGPAAVIVHADDFYQLSHLRTNEIGGFWDMDRLESQLLKPLRKNQPAHYRRYDWESDRFAEVHYVPAGGFVIVEGCYSMLRRLLSYYDFTIWVESPPSVRLQRGIERDGEAMRKTWETIWMPAEEKYIKEENPLLAAHVMIKGTECYEN